MSPGQINAVAPSALAGQKSAQAVVSRYGQSSAPVSVPVSETSPAIFTYTPNGSTQGAPLNFNPAFPSYSANGPDNPAAPGSVVVLFATGTGPWEDPEDAGGISLVARPFVALPVSLTIGGQPSRILYAGASPYQTLGMLQVNAFVPEGIGQGPQPVVLSIGGVDNAEQRATIAIK